MFAQVTKRLSRDERGSRGGDEDLSTMSSPGDTSGSVNVRANVAFLGQ